MSVRITALLALLVAALTLGGGGGAGAASQPPPKIDLSSPAAIDAYLRSIGVDPATVVKQVGLKNYAGPNCPGADWNCTTATRVVQVSHENQGQEGQGDNEFECKPKQAQVPPTSEGANTCLIVQTGTSNHATCTEEDSNTPSTETCEITQTDAKKNSAEVDQEITQTGELAQDGNQFAHVHQEASNQNQSKIQQTVTQKTASGVSTDIQMQDALQQVKVEQLATGSNNSSNVRQSQTQTESGDALTQLQNTKTQPANCTDDTAKPPNPNQCTNVEQDAGSGGTNLSYLQAGIGEKQTSSPLSTTGTQTQGSSSGGQGGDIDQTNPSNVGQNTSFANLSLSQFQSSPTGSKSHNQATDPGCCGISQIGGAKSFEDIDESTVMSATGGLSPFQNTSLLGQENQVSGGGFAPMTSPSNSCEIEQNAQTNDASAHPSFSGSGSECIGATLATDCTRAACFCTPGIEGCPSPDTGGPGIGVANLPVVLLPSKPTFGLEIPMPDMSTPADFSP